MIINHTVTENIEVSNLSVDASVIVIGTTIEHTKAYFRSSALMKAMRSATQTEQMRNCIPAAAVYDVQSGAKNQNAQRLFILNHISSA